MRPRLQVKIINPLIGTHYPLPSYATSGSAGLDLQACIEQPLILLPDSTQLIPTGIAIHLDDPRLAAMILPRSGLGHRFGIILGNSIGLIDSDYQGELQISCWNRSQTAYEVKPGDRIAQLIVVPVIQIEFEQVTEFSTSLRGEGGFGHTGV